MPRPIQKPVVALVLALLACSDPTSPRDVEGEWGTTDARLTITLVSARFETSCWSGFLAMPFQFKDDGRFTSSGLLGYQGTNPPPQGSTVLANFSGRVQGNRMTLVVSPASLTLGPYEFQRDQSVTLPACP
ncbi:MAG TPA: hypothetical protein VF178_12625 [Gemmatimonadaceae bacterium]